MPKKYLKCQVLPRKSRFANKFAELPMFCLICREFAELPMLCLIAEAKKHWNAVESENFILLFADGSNP
jgi:hypothetical protein